VTAAGDELLGLDEELDLADAAEAELDVVALDREIAVPAIGMDLLLHRLDIGERGKIEILAPDKRRQFIQDGLPRRDVAGTGARLNQRRALPVLPDAAVVGERGFGGDRDLGRSRIGSQPQIDPEHVTVGGALLQKLHQAARQAHEGGARFGVVRHRGSGRIVEDDQIDVAGVVQLVRPHLAHGEHDVAATPVGMLAVGRFEPRLSRGSGQQ
jgi:hypothetical protein